MEVQMKLKGWKVEKSDDGDKRITGSYELFMGDTSVATQLFNNGYDGKKISFSKDLLDAAKDLEGKISEEIQDMLK